MINFLTTMAEENKDNGHLIASATIKRPATPPANEVPQKKLKEILKNATTTTSVTTGQIATNSIPAEFFDSKPSAQTSNYFEATLQKTSIRKDLVNFNREERHVEQTPMTSSDVKMETDELLPEGLFDDPVKDAKARNLDYKDPVEEEEWGKKRRNKAASSLSNAIIADDQEEATTELQIDEIDEMIGNWSRVLNLQKKWDTVKKKDVTNSSRKSNTNNKDDSSDDEDDDDEDFDEYIDWRAKSLPKKSYKKANKFIK